MDFREREERSRIFWEDVGCLIQIMIAVACVIIVTFASVAIYRNGHVETSAVCRPDAHVELLLIQDGFNWTKELMKVTPFDGAAGSQNLLSAHKGNVTVFDDIGRILFCSPHGVVLQGTLKGAKSSAIFEVNWEKKITLYEGYIP